MKRNYSDADLDSPSGKTTVSDLAVGDTPIKNKSRACSECKRHKIKCQTDAGQSKCRRCLRQDLKCEINNSLQKFVDDDAEWKAAAKVQSVKLESAVSDILRHLHLPRLSSYAGGPSDAAADASSHSHVQNEQSVTSHAATRPGALEVPSIAVTREPSQEPNLDDDGIVSAPTDALYEVTRLRNLRSNRNGNGERRPERNLLEEDFVSRGALPLAEAESLFESFYHTMNQFLWGGIIMKHTSLDSVRRSSSLLSAAILAVASLHIPGRIGALDTCYNEFVTLVSNSILRRHCTLDDIRALCIGAFWLPDLSWRLSGQAVRLGMEMNLHQSFQKMTRGAPEQYERAQLWYLLYVCDRQFSTAYGRPPVIFEDSAITKYESFLQYPCVGPGDFRLMAQVSLFITLTKVYHRFGTDLEEPLTEDDFSHLRHYNIELDKWRNLWYPRSLDSPYVHTYPSKGVALHYYFAKFQINSLSVRAINPQASIPLSASRKEAANIAISSATSTLTFILDELDMRNAIVGVPLFTHTMIAFSAVFLLKVALTWNGSASSTILSPSSAPSSSSPSLATATGLHIDVEAVEDLVDQVIALMHNAVASEKHLTRHIAIGLSKMLAKFKRSMRGITHSANDLDHRSSSHYHHHQQHPQTVIGGGSIAPATSGGSAFPPHGYQHHHPTLSSYTNGFVTPQQDHPSAENDSSLSTPAAATSLPRLSRIDGGSGGGLLFDDLGMSSPFGFSFEETWQEFPATTLDFLTSQWQSSEVT